MANIIKRSDFFTPSIFKDFFEDDFFNDKFFRRRTLPPINVLEEKDKYQIEVSVPGIEKENIKVTRNKDMLTISYEQKISDEKKDKNYYRKEFQSQSFSRSFSLPEDVAMEKISSEHKDGVLTISLPKKEITKKEDIVDIEVK